MLLFTTRWRYDYALCLIRLVRGIWLKYQLPDSSFSLEHGLTGYSDKVPEWLQLPLSIPVFILFNILPVVRLAWKNKVIIFALQWICSYCFLTCVSLRHAALGDSLPANSNTSKILGVSIPDCACVTKHKTNICCRENKTRRSISKACWSFSHWESVSGRSTLPVLPLSLSPSLSFLSCFPVYAVLFLNGV